MDNWSDTFVLGGAAIVVGGLSGKIYINRFIKTRFVVAGYLLLYKGFSFHFYGIARNFD